jgi:hypothetical protein
MKKLAVRGEQSPEVGRVWTEAVSKKAGLAEKDRNNPRSLSEASLVGSAKESASKPQEGKKA